MLLFVQQNLSSARVNYSLSCASGSYAITGQTANFKRAYSLSCASGLYAVTGQPNTLTYTPGSSKIDYTLSAATGNYAILGNSATLTYLNKAQVIWGGAGTYKGPLVIEVPDYELDDEESVIMFLIQEVIANRFI